jgi:hypothetical protein
VAWLPLGLSLCPRPPPPHASSRLGGLCLPSFPVEVVLGGRRGFLVLPAPPQPVTLPTPWGRPSFLLVPRPWATTTAAPTSSPLRWPPLVSVLLPPPPSPPTANLLFLHPQTPAPQGPPRLSQPLLRVPSLPGLSWDHQTPVLFFSSTHPSLMPHPCHPLIAGGPGSVRFSSVCLSVRLSVLVSVAGSASLFLCDYNF